MRKVISELSPFALQIEILFGSPLIGESNLCNRLVCAFARLFLMQLPVQSISGRLSKVGFVDTVFTTSRVKLK